MKILVVFTGGTIGCVRKGEASQAFGPGLRYGI